MSRKVARHQPPVPSQAMIDEALIREAARRLAAASPGARVVLFGSHARGDASHDSDVDFLIVEPDEDDGTEAVRLMRALRDLRIPAEVIVVSECYAEEWREVRGSLVNAALSEGRELPG